MSDERVVRSDRVGDQSEERDRRSLAGDTALLGLRVRYAATAATPDCSLESSPVKSGWRYRATGSTSTVRCYCSHTRLLARK